MRDTIEIERKFLLSRMPDLPPGVPVERLAIEQGYLPSDLRLGELVGGRLRRQVDDRGRTRLIHTVKDGAPPARREREVDLDRAAFEAAWSETEGRRLRKTRYRVPDADSALVWEIDQFLDRDLVVAEVELPATGHPVVVPEWLIMLVVREVTGEPAFQNSALAR